MIDHLTQIILNCTTNSPTPEAGARLAAYRVADELRKAMVSSHVAGRRLAQGAMFPREYDRDPGYRAKTDELANAVLAAAWDAVLDGKEATR